MIPYWKEDSVSVLDSPVIAYLVKLISNIFRSVDRGHNHRNRIWNEAVYLVILSAYIRIYLKVEDYETKNKTCVDTKYEWEKMAEASILISSHYQVLQGRAGQIGQGGAVKGRQGVVGQGRAEKGRQGVVGQDRAVKGRQGVVGRAVKGRPGVVGQGWEG